ncbi:MAG: hypothetical protein LBM98_11110 [Oscillospiraceae bacterium]|nr:hypothetical protein [Oscillospiraceae bacterium]
MRYVLRIGAKQSSAAVRRYVSLACTTGLLRTCNIVRISRLPVLRNDGRGKPRPPVGGSAPCADVTHI